MQEPKAKSNSDKNISSDNDNHRNQAIQGRELPNKKALDRVDDSIKAMKRSSSISKIEKLKRNKRVGSPRQRRRTNSETLSASLLSLLELLPSESSMHSYLT